MCRNMLLEKYVGKTGRLRCRKCGEDVDRVGKGCRRRSRKKMSELENHVGEDVGGVEMSENDVGKRCGENMSEMMS